MKKFTKYFLWGILFWLIVEWFTAFQPNLGKWLSYWPEIWLFYITFPLIFAHLIYTQKWNEKQIFISTILTIFIVEVIFAHNTLLYTWPVMIAIIPIAIAIYGFLIFIPKWIVEEKLRENTGKIIIMTVVMAIVSISTYLTSTA